MSQFPTSLDRYEQAGTGPSRRHIQGSKIAKRLPSVKYSLLQYSKIKNFSKKNVRKNYIFNKMNRVARRGSLAPASGALKSHVAEKLKGGTLWSRPVWYVTRKNRKNFFGSVR